MPIQVKCPNPGCAQSLRVKDELAGKSVRCPTCKTAIQLPNAPSPVATAPAKSAPSQAPPPGPAREKVSTRPAPPRDEDDLPRESSKKRLADPPKKSAPREDDEDERPRKAGKSRKDEDEDQEDKPRKSKKQKTDLDDLPDTLWEDCDLFRHKRLSTKGKFSLWKNSFRIFNPDTDEEIGLAEENLPAWKGWLRMVKAIGNWLTIDIEIREKPDGPVLFYMRRLPKPMPWNLTTKIQILDFRKKLIGYFQTKLFSIGGGFWIYDAKDKQVAELKAKILTTRPRMDFLDVDGELLGDVRAAIFDDQKKKGVSLIFGAMPMVMSMNEEIESHIPTKILFLAATMASQLSMASSKVNIGS
jgi:uncharacterized protein YxjI